MNSKRSAFIMILLFSVVWTPGCEIMPVTRFKPTLHNPFPQLTTIAVAPFYNMTSNANVDGREFAKCYANELQRVPGFHVIANELVEETMLQNDMLKLESVDDIRYLAQLLKVDAIVIGKIHDFSSYYPPRVKLETEWYAVNPYLHSIPFGYGLPWGTEHEAFIPDKIALLAEKELATAQIKTQTPEYEPVKRPAPVPENVVSPPETRHQPEADRKPDSREAKKENPIRQAALTLPNNLGVKETDEDRLSRYTEIRQEQFQNKNLAMTGVPYIPETRPIDDAPSKTPAWIYDPALPHPLQDGPWPSRTAQPNQNPWSAQSQYPSVQQNQMDPGQYQGHYPGFPQPPGLTPEQLAQYGWINQSIAPIPPMYATMPGMAVEGRPGMIYGEPDRFPGLPVDWPDPRGLIPEGPKPEKPKGEIKNDGPVMSHIAIYNGNDAEFMQSLQDYDFLFRDDRRIAGKQSLLNNRAEFVGFCCRLHIWEMLGARGGAGQAEKVVREWKLWKGGENPF